MVGVYGPYRARSDIPTVKTHEKNIYKYISQAGSQPDMITNLILTPVIGNRGIYFSVIRHFWLRSRVASIICYCPRSASP